MNRAINNDGEGERTTENQLYIHKTKDVEIMKMSNPKEFYSAQTHSSNSIDEPNTISIHLKAV